MAKRYQKFVKKAQQQGEDENVSIKIYYAKFSLFIDIIIIRLSNF